jgi:response regulator RpfG family c-di-GMP phosphodiesterase
MMGDKPRILVVDDEPQIRRLLRGLLEREGYLVEVCADGNEALAVVLARPPDLLITDLKMPGLDGLTLARSVHAASPSLPVMLMTAYSSHQTAVQAIHEGITDYIEKPFSPTDFTASVGRIIRNVLLARENAGLLDELRLKNAELDQHRERLTVEVRAAETDLSAANEALARRLRDLEILREINQMTSLVHDAPGLLQLSCRLVRDKMGVDAAIFTHEPETATQTLRGFAGSSASAARGDTLPSDSGLLGRAILGGSPLLIPSALEDARLTRTERVILGDGPLLIVPIRGKDRSAGLLCVSRAPGQAPFAPEEQSLLALIAHDLGIALENLRLFALSETAWINALAGLVSSMETRHLWLQRHSDRVRAWSERIAESLGLPAGDREALDTGARLHDLGKVGIADSILLKPGRLDDGEMGEMRRHPVIGDLIVRKVAGLNAAQPVIRHHHERWDGSGYPDGLVAHAIPLLSQIVSLADAFDAMTSPRPYRGPLPFEEALHRVRACSGTQFNPFLVAVFADIARGTPPSPEIDP